MNILIILEALCYALYQAWSSDICVTRENEGIGSETKQLEELATEISCLIEECHVKPESIRWYDEELVTRYNTCKCSEENTTVEDTAVYFNCATCGAQLLSTDVTCYECGAVVEYRSEQTEFNCK